MYFRDRTEAAELLAEKLAKFRGKDPLVLGIPRGAVPMAATLADWLDGDLDVVLVHKLGAPMNPEFAVGAVSEFGTIYRSPSIEADWLPEGYLETAAQEELVKLRNRRRTYSPIRPPVDPAGRTVIIVDDGIATGSTMIAAARAVRSQHPRRLVIAAPIASAEASKLLAPEADELVILDAPEDFFAISQFYGDFPQIEDEEVIRIISESAARKETRESA